MRNFIQTGDIVTVAAPAAVSSGDGVLVGTLFGIATTDADSGADVVIKTTGVFELPKTSAQAWTVGAAIYWDADDKVATTTSTDNTLIGKALAIANNPSATGIVRLA
jgi:predicted RecA/RadA family phage recombinase